jgi:methylmalonyl-CoA mutase C-terminal domain/subunit
MQSRTRILIAKVGLDGHDRGAKFIAQGLRDRGYEVIYTGIRRTPSEVVSAVVQEDVRFLGISLLSGGHLELLRQVMERLRTEGSDDVVVFAGGIIPRDDVPALEALGVRCVFGPGTTLDQIEEFLQAHSEVVSSTS